MKRKTIGLRALLAGTLLLAVCLLTREGARANANERRLRTMLVSLAEVGEPECTLNEVVPFAWDAVYTFAPYTSRAQIEQAIGFSSNLIEETVSEGQTQLLFVHNGRVVASVCGYPDTLGYRVEFAGVVTYEEQAKFAVTSENGIAVLTIKEAP